MAGQKTYSREFLESLRSVPFDVHPEILRGGAPLPRKTDGGQYVAPEASPPAAATGPQGDEDA